MHNKFKARIELIGINPFVFIPQKVLQKLFTQAGRSRGPIPVCGLINDKKFKQTLVKYSGEWRLYINTTMLKNSPKRIGETIAIAIRYDPENREISPPSGFLRALDTNAAAKKVFYALSPSRQREIVRYLAHLKSATALERNIKRAINFLKGNEGFVGRDKL